MIAPMLAREANFVPSGKEYIYEIKLDGQRTIAEIAPRNLALYTRSSHNVTAKYPEFADLRKNIRKSKAVLDGEIVALQDGIPSFQLLQQRMSLHDKRLIQTASANIPCVYYVFDILEYDGKSLLKLPLHERKKILKQALITSDNVKLLPSFQSRDQILSKAEEFGYEGIVAKRENSLYVPGVRTDAWIKYKFHKEETFLICGWLDGGRARNFGALLLGKYHGRHEYRYVGRAGTGFTDRMIHYLMQQLLPLEIAKAPFPNAPRVKGVHWVRPSLKARVEFREMTQAGVMRAPVFLGLAQDRR